MLFNFHLFNKVTNKNFIPMSFLHTLKCYLKCDDLNAMIYSKCDDSPSHITSHNTFPFPLKAVPSFIARFSFVPHARTKTVPSPLPQRMTACIPTSDWVRRGTWSLLWNDCNQGEGKDRGCVLTPDISYNQALTAGAVIVKRERKRTRLGVMCHASDMISGFFPPTAASECIVSNPLLIWLLMANTCYLWGAWSHLMQLFKGKLKTLGEEC